MKVLFESQDLWDIIEKGIEEPTSQTVPTQQEINTLKEIKKKDKKAKKKKERSHEKPLQTINIQI